VTWEEPHNLSGNRIYVEHVLEQGRGHMHSLMRLQSDFRGPEMAMLLVFYDEQTRYSKSCLWNLDAAVAGEVN
jgi:hypothetical protein